MQCAIALRLATRQSCAIVGSCLIVPGDRRPLPLKTHERRQPAQPGPLAPVCVCWGDMSRGQIPTSPRKTRVSTSVWRSPPRVRLSFSGASCIGATDTHPVAAAAATEIPRSFNTETL